MDTLLTLIILASFPARVVLLLLFPRRETRAALQSAAALQPAAALCSAAGEEPQTADSILDCLAEFARAAAGHAGERFFSSFSYCQGLKWQARLHAQLCSMMKTSPSPDGEIGRRSGLKIQDIAN